MSLSPEEFAPFDEYMRLCSARPGAANPCANSAKPSDVLRAYNAPIAASATTTTTATNLAETTPQDVAAESIPERQSQTTSEPRTPVNDAAGKHLGSEFEAVQVILHAPILTTEKFHVSFEMGYCSSSFGKETFFQTVLVKRLSRLNPRVSETKPAMTRAFLGQTQVFLTRSLAPRSRENPGNPRFPKSARMIRVLEPATAVVPLIPPIIHRFWHVISITHQAINKTVYVGTRPPSHKSSYPPQYINV